jgi:quercetin dioxygenase-like cupin family protein
VSLYRKVGQLAVQTEGKERRQYNAGEAFIESVNMWHKAFNEGDQPTKLLVVARRESPRLRQRNSKVFS